MGATKYTVLGDCYLTHKGIPMEVQLRKYSNDCYCVYSRESCHIITKDFNEFRDAFHYWEYQVDCLLCAFPL